MNSNSYLSSWIKRFLLEYLISVRNLSKNTQHSYRDTFKLMLPFVANCQKKPIEKLLVEDVTAENVKSFLLSLEKCRKNSVSTRNQRLSAIHALARFIGLNSPEYMEWFRQIQLIPIKKAQRTLITYLEKNEMDALLDAPDKTVQRQLELRINDN